MSLASPSRSLRQPTIIALGAEAPLSSAYVRLQVDEPELAFSIRTPALRLRPIKPRSVQVRRRSPDHFPIGRHPIAVLR